MTGDGRASEGDEDGVRGARRIPGPRGAADDLDLAAVPLPPLPPLPPPGAGTPGEAVPEQSGADAGAPAGEDTASAASPDERDTRGEPGPEPEPAAPDDPAEPEPDACEPAESGPEPETPGADRTPADGVPAPASGFVPAPVPDP
ncbi:immediate early protein, partial [Streptomyces californicus]